MTILGTVLLLAVMLLTFGCERKIINEISDGLIADATTCFACHSDQNFSLVAAQEQWNHSKHASGDNIDRNRFYESYYNVCEKCHTNEGFVMEVTGESADPTNFTAIGCFTCHTPHTKGNLELRLTDAVSLANSVVYDRGLSNICVACHQSRTNIEGYITDDFELSTRFGPHHSNQGDMLLGTNAYEYDGYEYENSYHSHGVENGCLQCHMSPSMDYVLGGHSLGMVDEPREHINSTGCNVTACHNGEIEESFDYDGIQTEVEELLDSLQTLLLAADLIEPEDEGGVIVYLPVDGREVATADSAGAVFNYLFVHEDRSHGVHNAEYTIGLLESSINYLLTGSPDKIASKND